MKPIDYMTGAPKAMAQIKKGAFLTFFLTITDGSLKKKTKVVSDNDFKHKLRDHFENHFLKK